MLSPIKIDNPPMMEAWIPKKLKELEDEDFCGLFLEANLPLLASDRTLGGVLILGLVLGYGTFRIDQFYKLAQTPEKSLAVASVQPNVPAQQMLTAVVAGWGFDVKSTLGIKNNSG